MPTYVTLINWTDQGVKNFKDTVDPVRGRAEDDRRGRRLVQGRLLDARSV
jgi:uncharacterized protein with GYD domain